MTMKVPFYPLQYNIIPLHIILSNTPPQSLRVETTDRLVRCLVNKSVDRPLVKMSAT